MSHTTQIPKLDAATLAKMVDKAVAMPQEKPTSNVIPFPKKFVTGGALGGLAFAASVALVISVYQTPQGDVDAFTDVTDMLFYETLDDLS